MGDGSNDPLKLSHTLNRLMRFDRVTVWPRTCGQLEIQWNVQIDNSNLNNFKFFNLIYNKHQTFILSRKMYRKSKFNWNWLSELKTIYCVVKLCWLLIINNNNNNNNNIWRQHIYTTRLIVSSDAGASQMTDLFQSVFYTIFDISLSIFQRAYRKCCGLFAATTITNFTTLSGRYF